ncbi:hypothetical protein PRZ48_008395 [Zasmidium cellare]|uniref:F-box domain-containing protein n=1 Tax=Zasmidium cellare TaxID=395010 RepID=A0ABR0EFC0_ZASCE|nr:hypothetical protein PRZ48_008395 [Zasmidium cellare]
MAPTAASSASQSTAAHRTFTVPEVLEMIFLPLSIPDLLSKIPRVCKHWKARVDSSVKLQRALFFKPSTDVMIKQQEEGMPGLCFELIQGSDKMWTYPIIANPFLFEISNDYLVSHADASRMPKGIDRPEASWRRMLVTQPPMDNVHVHSQWCGCENLDLDLDCRTKAPAQGKEGVKMGQVVREGATPMYTTRWEEMQAESAGRMLTILEVALEYNVMLELENGAEMGDSDDFFDSWE